MQSIRKLCDLLTVNQYFDRTTGISLLLDRKEQIMHPSRNKLLNHITQNLLLRAGETSKLVL